MERKKLLILLCFLLISVISDAFADTIILKSGKKIKGKILERTNEKVVVDIFGVEVPYFSEEIESISVEPVKVVATGNIGVASWSKPSLQSSQKSSKAQSIQKDISPEEAITIINNYEKAYMDRNIDKMIEYIDQSSSWFQKGFSSEFKAVFSHFTNIKLYHFSKRSMFYIDDGIEIVQDTLYVAYSPTLTDINEFKENYYLKKVNGKYKISECFHLRGKDVEFVDKGTASMYENNVEGAIISFKQALEANPNNSAAHFRLGMIYVRTGKPKEALEELKKAVGLRPNVGFYRLELSQAYRQLGEEDKANKELATAVYLDPGIETTLVIKK